MNRSLLLRARSLAESGWAYAIVFGAALATALWSSARVGVSFDEVSRLGAVQAATELIHAVADNGFAALLADEASPIYASTKRHGTLLVLLSAWSRLSLGRLGLIEPVSSLRFAWLVCGATAPVLLMALCRRGLGPSLALLAAVCLLAQPVWQHAVATTSPSVTLAALYLGVALLHTVSLGDPRWRWSLGCAALLGVAVAIDRAALWAVPVLVLQRLVGSSTASARVPLWVGLAPLVVPVAMIAAAPHLWGRPPVEVVAWVFDALQHSERAVRFLGEPAVTTAPSYGLVVLALRTPLALSVAAVVGCGVLVHRELARRFASGSLRPKPDPSRLAQLVGIVLAGSLLLAPWLPAPLRRFPPSVELLLPLLSVPVAIGLARLGRLLDAKLGFALLCVLTVGIGLAALKHVRTGSAYTTALLRGAPHRSGWVDTTDGSELGGLQGTKWSATPLHAPSVPPGWLALMAQRGAFPWRKRPGDGRYRLHRGGGAESTVVVEREGVPLWSVTLSE